MVLVICQIFPLLVGVQTCSVVPYQLSGTVAAEFGDHEPERHTAEYLKDFVLLPRVSLVAHSAVSLFDAMSLMFTGHVLG